MAKKKTDREKLSLWQERLKRNQSAYEAEIAKMDRREALYEGARELRAIVTGERKTQTPHVRNMCAELIESQVDSNIPQPKVTARRKEDELLAKLIEDMLRNELDRMPFEQLNDMMERTVPIQGGSAFLVEWDNTERTHYTIGELAVSALHPKQIIPQAGVYTGIEDMDYVILKIPQTKGYIRRRYGVTVDDETEAEPEIKGGSEAKADDLVTQYIGYYRNDKGGIGLYSWVNDLQLDDLSDYQSRRLRRCKQCGATEPLDTEPLDVPTANGMPPVGLPMPTTSGTMPDMLTGMIGHGSPANIPAVTSDSEARKPAGGSGRATCPYCGGNKWEEGSEDVEELHTPVKRSDGSMIGGMEIRRSAGEADISEMGEAIAGITLEPTRIPFYKPDIYPIVLQKSVSIYGKFLGDSDIDKIADQQNTTNRISAKIIDKLLKSGSYITLPDDACIKVDADDMKVIRPGNPADKAMIDVYDLQGNVESDLVYLSQLYEEARQEIGITDSYQGRRDTTATSGKAKEFAAAQSAGRLESKRVMKDAAYAALFEAMFKFKLAYTDEPRAVVSSDIHGNAQYAEFNRYDFLERDAAGEWCWNDQFLFSCDTSAPLASNREAMWQETRMNLQTGAFGDPTQLATLILFWSKMETLHYPTAGETRAYLEEELKKQQMEMQRQMQMQQIQMQMQQSAQMERQQAGIEAKAAERKQRQGGDIDPAFLEAATQKAQFDAAIERQTMGVMPV